jgi:hypothetical protein
VFAERWISEILIPNPGACGYSSVEVRSAQPSLSIRRGLIQSWAADPECVLLWAGLHMILAVSFRTGRRKSPDEQGEEGAVGVESRLVVRPGLGSVPVYFDYSGLWARYGNQPAPPSYPAGLDTTSVAVDRRDLRGAASLLGASEAAVEPAPRWTSLLRLPRARREALNHRIVQARPILNLRGIPPFTGRRVSEVVLIHGTFRRGHGAQRLLNELAAECRVFPFLMAESSGHVLLAGVGQTSSRATGRVVVPAARKPVLPTITDSLEPANVLIEPVEAIEEYVRHRYPKTIPALTLSTGNA